MEKPINKTWHTLPVTDSLQALNSAEDGLTSAEAAQRLSQFGPNKLEEGKKKSLAAIFLAQFSDFMIWVLIAAAAVSGFMGEWVDAAIILFVVVLNAILGTFQESKAEAALEALKNMAAPSAKVLRDKVLKIIPASELVLGDVVALEAGDSVPADIRLISSSSLKIEESALTGESVPVDKDTEAVAGDNAPLGDRTNIAHMGTNVTYGRAMGVVTAGGMDTQMGKIAGQLASTTTEATPLQKNLNQISNTLSVGILIIAAVIFVVGVVGGREVFEMFLTAVSLAVAAIPEGMVAVITIVLAMGMGRMAQRGAIIRRLPAVETLGSTQIICSDKTGTLTQNKMTVKALWTNEQKLMTDALAYCNDSRLDDAGKPIGDPTETALIDYLVNEKIWTVDEIRGRERCGEIPFDSDRKLSTVAVKSERSVRIFVKGAPDVLISRCVLEAGRRKEIEAENEAMAKKALRVLAFGYKDAEKIDEEDVAGTESGLTFIGLVGMIDPARPEVKDAIKVCRDAGIVPVMITGDHKITAVAIAEDLGMLSDGRKAITGAELEEISDADFDREIESIGVYARVAPEHKSRIVNTWQKKGKIVAMTGDGVNDAPALKAADIGVGMGITGTDVSKGASDMVLTDDNFATIVTAVGEGRRIFDNIHKTVKFLLSCNVGEVVAILIATIAGWNILAPVHILWVNLVTDTFPALALGVEAAEDDIMQRPPRDSRITFFRRQDWMQIAVNGFVTGVLTLLAYLIGNSYYQNHELGMTMAFLTLTFTQLFAAVGFQSERTSILKMHFGKHRALWLAFFGSAALQLVVILIPPLRQIFSLSALTLLQFLITVGLSFVMLLYIEIMKFVRRRITALQ